MDKNSNSSSDNKAPLDVGAVVHPEGSEPEVPQPPATASEPALSDESATSESNEEQAPKPAYVPPITPGEKYQPNGDKKGLAKSIILLVIGLVLVALGAAGGYYQQHQQVTQKAKEIMQLQGKLATTDSADRTSSSTKSTVPSGFTTYENKDLGVKFSYPKEWGQVNVSSQNNTLLGKFSSNNKVLFGATAQGLPAPQRDIGFSNYTGYILQGDSYYIRAFSSDSNGSRTFVYFKDQGKDTKLIKAVNTNVLLLDKTTGGIGDPGYEAITNLNNTTYNSLNFSLNDTSEAALKLFEQMLQTVELTK